MGIKKLTVLVMALIMCLIAVSAMAVDEVQVTIGSTVTQHENLRKAFDHIMDKNATGNIEVKLLADSMLDISDVANYYNITKKNQNTTILLNNKTMTVDAKNTWWSLEVKGDLTIKGSGSLVFTEETNVGFFVYDDATLRLERVNCSYKANGGNPVVIAYDGSTVQFLGGSYNIKNALIGATEDSKVQISEDVYDDLKNNLVIPEYEIEFMPPLSMLEVTPSWAPVVIDMPQTGDNTSLMLWASMLALAMAGFAVSRKTRLN